MKTYGVDYSPNYNAIFPNTNISVPNFKRTISRKSIEKPFYTLNENSYDSEKYINNSQILKSFNQNDIKIKNSLIFRIISPNFDLMSKRIKTDFSLISNKNVI